jgi:hypothetical protein
MPPLGLSVNQKQKIISLYLSVLLPACAFLWWSELKSIEKEGKNLRLFPTLPCHVPQCLRFIVTKWMQSVKNRHLRRTPKIHLRHNTLKGLSQTRHRHSVSNIKTHIREVQLGCTGRHSFLEAVSIRMTKVQTFTIESSCVDKLLFRRNTIQYI